MADSHEQPPAPAPRRRRLRWLLALFASLLVLAFLLLRTDGGRHVQFELGGVLVNLGYRMQDHLESYDFWHHEDITPEHIWNEILVQNQQSSSVRSLFPRSTRHPLVVMVVCMDARLDTNELIGDTRRYYYIIRTAGSVLSEREEEMLELAVENGVKLILWTTHTDCAAERAASSTQQRERFPALAKAVDERNVRVAEFLGRPAIAQRITQGRLAVKQVLINTTNEAMSPR